MFENTELESPKGAKGKISQGQRKNFPEQLKVRAEQQFVLHWVISLQHFIPAKFPGELMSEARCCPLKLEEGKCQRTPGDLSSLPPQEQEFCFTHVKKFTNPDTPRGTKKGCLDHSSVGTFLPQHRLLREKHSLL